MMKMNMKIRRHKRFRFKRELKAGLVIITLALLILIGFFVYRNQPLPVATISVEDIVIREDEALPPLEFKVECEKENVKLEKKYTLQSLLEELQAGNGYQLIHEADLTKEGTYQLSIQLNEENQKKYDKSWSKRVELKFESSNVTVKNKFGDWVDKSFVLLDGTEAIGWMNIGGFTYYFNENGECVTGEQVIGKRTYYFADDGKLEDEKNVYNPAKPAIALTFDDGPGPYTQTLLNALDEHNARATFFMLGRNVNKYPDTIKKMVEIGCELGNHSTNHADLTKLSVQEIEYEINTTDNAIASVAGKESSFVRPPYGALSSVVKSTVKYPQIMWSLDTLDWESKNVEMIKKEVLEKVKDGDIILLHDIHETTVQAVIELLPLLKDRGYQFLTVSELAEMRGATLENGEKYFNFYK